MIKKYFITLCIGSSFFIHTSDKTLENTKSIMHPAEIRQLFARNLSDMFSQEVSEYNQFKEIVKESNKAFIQKNPTYIVDAQERVLEEKHGAIRVGTPYEMHMVTRIFNVFGMHPVGFYDLTQLSKNPLPMIATAFRPIDKSIETSAFRMFCSMMHPAYIKPEIKKDVIDALAQRNENNPKFSEKLKTLLSLAEKQGLTSAQAQKFVTEVVNAFKINTQKPIPFNLYKILRKENDVFADIVCLGINTNHLTPRVYDIQDATNRLKQAGIPMKDGGIEGPPLRNAVPILLNQTSRKAPGEPLFVSNDKSILSLPSDSPLLNNLKKNAPQLILNTNETVHAYLERIKKALEHESIVQIEHKARFGEIEARGVALTPKGEKLYHSLLAEGKFDTDFPRTHHDLFIHELAYYTIEVSDEKINKKDINTTNITDFIKKNLVQLIPLTYEDFLAESAAGIFTSNLSTGINTNAHTIKSTSADNKLLLENAMGRKIIDRHALCQCLCY